MMKKIHRILTTISILAFCGSFFTISAWATPSTNQPASGKNHRVSSNKDVQAVISQQESDLKIEYHAGTGKARLITTQSGAPIQQSRRLSPGAAPEQTAQAFLQEYGQLFGIQEPVRELSLQKSSASTDGGEVLRFQQMHEGVPVMGGELVVQLDRNQAVRSANGEIQPDLDLTVTPRMDAGAARQKALELVARNYQTSPDNLSASDPELWIYSPVLLGAPGIREPALVWRMEIISSPSGAGTSDAFPIRELVLIHAHTGIPALNFSLLDTAKYREIYDNNNNYSLGLPGSGPARIEGGGPVADAEVNDAYDYLGATYDFYWNIHNRDSLDDQGMKLVSTVQYCPSSLSCPYGNAFWDGSQMVFGDGFSSADDVVAHELTHGVTENESGLFYYMQSGAINEAFSDIWGEFIDLTYTNGRDNDSPGVRWLMGEDLPGIGAIRNMADPTAFNDPDKMTSGYYYCGSDDNGGVHYNSGVANKTAYLITDGGSFNGYTISGLGIQKTARIFYEVQTNFLTSAGDFADLGSGLNLACSSLVGQFGITASDCQEVSKAVSATELLQQPACSAVHAPVCAGTTLNYFFDSFEDPSSPQWNFTTLLGPKAWFFPPSANQFSYDTTYATSGAYNLWGYNPQARSDNTAEMKQAVSLPASTPAFLHFNHAYEFEPGSYDGGVLEYSLNGGDWTDAGSLFTHNGYNGTISPLYSNPLGGRSGFVNKSNGMYSSRADLSGLAGGNVRFRFRIGTDTSVDNWGWFIDDVRISSCPSSPPPPFQTYLPISLNAKQDTFHSSFNGISVPWIPASGNWNTTQIHYSTIAQTDKVVSASYPVNFSNFIYEVRLKRFGKCETCPSRIYIRGTPSPLDSTNQWNSYYLFQYSNDGWYSVFKRIGGVVTALANWTESSLLVTGNEWNVLRVAANGSSLSFYINDQLAWSGNDASLSSGMVGVGLYSDNDWDTLAVDWAYLKPLTSAGLSLSTENPFTVPHSGEDPVSQMRSVHPNENRAP